MSADKSDTPRTPLLQRLHARLDSDYKLRRMSSLARGLEMTEMPGETEQLLIDATSEVTALTAANADLTAQLAEARSIAWEWGQGVDDAEAAIRKLSRMFPIDAMKEPK